MWFVLIVSTLIMTTLIMTALAGLSRCGPTMLGTRVVRDPVTGLILRTERYVTDAALLRAEKQDAQRAMRIIFAETKGLESKLEPWQLYKLRCGVLAWRMMTTEGRREFWAEAGGDLSLLLIAWPFCMEDSSACTAANLSLSCPAFWEGVPR